MGEVKVQGEDLAYPSVEVSINSERSNNYLTLCIWLPPSIAGSFDEQCRLEADFTKEKVREH